MSKIFSTSRQISSLISTRLSDSKRRAKKKGHEHDIDHAYISHLLKVSGGRCPLTQRKFVIELNHPDNFSLDRIDSSKGYTKNNVWLITTWANIAKSDLSLEDFRKNCNLVAEAA